MLFEVQIMRARLMTAACKLAALAKTRCRTLTQGDAAQVAVAAMIMLVTLHIASAQHRIGLDLKPSALRSLEIDAAGSPDAGALPLFLGDRLKVTFFERIEAADEDQPSAKAPSSNMVERVELTGEYTIQQDGNLFLPLLGSTPVAGKSMQHVQAALRGAFKAAFGREAKVGLVIVEREPVYVVGPVGRPGTYKYTPGMTVLHAIALAGGFEGASADVMQYLEAMRENERLQRAAERLKVLLARGAVLTAERFDKPPEAPARLLELVGTAGAETLLAEVARMRRQAADSRQAQLRAIDTMIGSAKSELKSLHARAGIIQASIDARMDRLNELTLLKNRGTGSGFALLQARTELGDIQERLQEVLSAISRTELRLAQSEQERAKVQLDAEIERDRDLFATESEIAQEAVVLAISRHLVGAITKRSYNLPGAKPDMTFQILRRTIGGPMELSAGEASYLEPGDLIRISNKIETARH